VCDKETGTCTCERGWMPPNCALKECSAGYLSVGSPHPPPHAGCPNDCSCHGYCVCDGGESLDGQAQENCACQCAPSWAGADCALSVDE
jgi:hypothetical protein